MVSDSFLQKKQELQATCSLSAEADVGGLIDFVTEWWETNHAEIKKTFLH